MAHSRLRRSISCMVAGLLIVGQASGADDDIVFAQKLFTDIPNIGAVGISGTLTGDGVGYKNNTISISCFKDRGECYVSSIEQIGHNQMGRMQSVDIFPIMKWSADEVIAVQDVMDRSEERRVGKESRGR